MLQSYTEGQVVLEMAELRNPIVAFAVRKYISKEKGIKAVKIKGGVVTIEYDPAVLPTRVLLERGMASLAKYGITIEIPNELMESLPKC